jgi:hypothetical protein
MDIIDPADIERRRRRERMEHNHQVLVKFGLRRLNGSSIRRTKAQAQSAAYYRWTTMGDWSTLPYAVAPGSLILGGLYEKK